MLLLLHSPEALLRFLRQDLLQQDDGIERSDATRRRRRTFIADSQHSTVRFKSQSSVIATINSSNISPIYQSTRIFTVFATQDKNLWKILNRVEQEISLTYLQTKHFLFCDGGGFFSFTLPKHFCVFSCKICCNEATAPRDLMQRDDGAERYVRWPWILLRW
ncbi:receptor-like protein kinase THESEUS 1 [Senna tora]|uniref:Receptor-like protein kinase THESEUS 1 n=1 Tax=Senna tora TaxID=362788 RepID=A0A834WU63_9FABA|nr:receptor-like protein kinase THESEUS 1 [Senna tora]KAF7832476.1 receptor-like protein kinase THESEUS 1 [Senna tora]